MKIWAVDSLDQPVEVIEYPKQTGRFSNLLWFGKDNASLLVETSDFQPAGVSVLDYRIYSVPDGELLQAIPPPSLPCYRQTLPFPSQGSTPYMDLTRPVLLVTPDPADDGTCPEFGPGTVWSYDLFTGETEPLWPGHSAGRLPTVTDDWTRLAVDQNDRVQVVDLTTGEVLRELPPGHADISGDGTIVLTGGRHPDPVKAIRVSDGSPVSVLPASDTLHFGSSGNVVYGRFPGSVRIFDVSTGAELYEVDGSTFGLVALSEDGNTVFSNGSDSTMRFSDISSHIIGHTQAAPMKPERGPFVGHGMDLSGDLVVSVARPVDGDRATHIYDHTGGELQLSLDGIGRALSPDGRLLAIQTRPEIVELDAEESDGNPGRYYVYGPLVLVDVNTGDEVRRLDGLCTWFNTPAYEVRGPNCSDEFPEPWQDWVLEAEFSPDGSLLAMGGRSDYVAVWDTRTGEMVWALDTPQGESQWLHGGVPTVAFSPDGSQLVVTQGAGRGPERMLVVDTTTWETLAEPELSNTILSAEFAPDGSFLAAGNALVESLLVYDTDTWKVRDLGSQTGPIESTSVSPDSSRVATTSPDGQTWIWDVATEAVIQKVSLPASASPFDAVFLDNHTLLVRSAEEIVTLFLDTDRLLEVARSRLTRSFTPEECATYDIHPCPTLEEIKARP